MDSWEQDITRREAGDLKAPKKVVNALLNQQKSWIFRETTGEL